MKLHLISLIRNERDILPSFLSHVSALFDSADLIDHMSTDGSAALVEGFCAGMHGWSFGRLNCAGYLQAELSSALMQRAFAAGADAIVFLDADEFIHVMPRDEIEQLVVGLNHVRKIGAFMWRNCAPKIFSCDFRVNRPSLIGEISVHRKIFVPRWLYREYGDAIHVNQGAHSLRIAQAHELLEIVNIGEMLHFPLRSERQFVRKVVATFLSQQENGRSAAPHIQQMLRMIGDGLTDDAAITAMAMRYSQFEGADFRDIRVERQPKFQIPNVALSADFTIDAIEREASGIADRVKARCSGERTVTINGEVIAL